jgi:hypothetical protein
MDGVVILIEGMKLLVFVFGAPVTLTFEDAPGALSVDCGDRILAALSVGVVVDSSVSSNMLPAKYVPTLPSISGMPYNKAMLHAYLSALYFII